MPELAEVAFACSKWDAGVGKKVFGVYTHPTSRVYRDERRDCFVECLQNSTLLSSYTHGKQMLFKFSGNIFIGIHLGMTGNLILGAKNYKQQKHDALVIIQSQNSLVFQDPRQFGRIRIHKGKNLPSWWRNLPPSIIEKKFNSEILESAIFRHRRKPIKALLLVL
jgi:formamidopyrimidine-DNA glycosylase